MLNKVLVVDDNPADQYLCEYAIQSFMEGCEVLKAYDGREALEVIAKTKVLPSLIFLDINMPRMNGFDFLDQYHRLSNVNIDVVVMLTVAFCDGDYEKCMSYEKVKKVISKPLSISTLEECFAVLE